VLIIKWLLAVPNGGSAGRERGAELLAPHAVWQPPVTGLIGQCGVRPPCGCVRCCRSAGDDTYFQSVAGQSFDITGVPNGTYYI
jgi:hypothetical protein